MDSTDLQILELLQENARITNVALAEAVNLSPAPCLRRVRDMEQCGLIRGHTTVLDQKKVGLDITMFIEVRLEKQAAGGLEAFEEAINSFPEVMDCHLMTGDYDYLLRVVARDLNSLQEFMTGKLMEIPSLANLRSSLVLKKVKQKTALPLQLEDVKKYCTMNEG